MDNLPSLFDFKVTGKEPHHFQLVGEEMEKYFGQKLYWMFSRPQWKHQDIECAFRECEKKKIKSVAYLIGILKKK